MYKQELYKIVRPLKLTLVSKMNRGKKWKYGYDAENDIIVISKTGQIGEIYEIQNLKIALPKKAKAEGLTNAEERWIASEYPKAVSYTQLTRPPKCSG